MVHVIVGCDLFYIIGWYLNVACDIVRVFVCIASLQISGTPDELGLTSSELATFSKTMALVQQAAESGLQSIYSNALNHFLKVSS